MAVFPAVERPELLDDLPWPAFRAEFVDDDDEEVLEVCVPALLDVIGAGVLIFVTTTVDGSCDCPFDGEAVTIDVMSCVVAGCVGATTVDVGMDWVVVGVVAGAAVVGVVAGAVVVGAVVVGVVVGSVVVGVVVGEVVATSKAMIRD
jgi:hypothetical protein